MQATDDKPRRRWAPRFTVRRLMVVVAVVAFGLGVGSALIKRSRRFQTLAEYHDKRRMYAFRAGFNWRDRKTSEPSMFDWYGDPVTPEADDWHAKMSLKYLEASRHPWLPVAPDPPEPK